MHPMLAGEVRAYLPFVLGGGLVGIVSFALLARRAGLSGTRAFVFASSLLVIGLLGGRAYTIIVEGDPLRLQSWASILSPGYRYPGVATAMLVALPLLARRLLPGVTIAAVADLGVPAFAFALAVARVGCFLEGCCFGIPSALPWAVSFPAGSPPAAHQMVYGLLPGDASESLAVHPLQLYFGLLALVAGLLAVAQQRWKRQDGEVLLTFMLLHETGKGLLESLRAADPLNGGTHLQLASFAMAALAAAWWIFRWPGRLVGART